MRRFCVANFYAVIGALIFCLALSAVSRPRLNHPPCPRATKRLAPLTPAAPSSGWTLRSLARRCVRALGAPPKSLSVSRCG